MYFHEVMSTFWDENHRITEEKNIILIKNIHLFVTAHKMVDSNAWLRGNK